MITGVRSRGSWVAPNTTTNLVGREDTDIGLGIALEERWKNPLLIMSKRLKKKNSDTIDFHWFEDVYQPYQDQVNYGTGYNNSATEIVVDDGDKFRAGNLVRHVVTDEIMLVTSISSDTLTVVRDRGQSTESWTAKAGSITDNDYLEIVGSAYEPMHPLPGIRTTQEVERVNYCQDFRTPLGLSEIAADTKTRGELDLPFQRRKKGLEHSHEIELTFWWGKPLRGDKANYVTATGTTKAAQTGGVNHFMETYASSSHLVDQAELTEHELIDLFEFAFEKGSNVKVCFCPGSLRLGLDKWGLSRQRTFESTTVLGLAAERYKVSIGEIIFITHEALKNPQSGQYNYSFILDMDELIYRGFGRDANTNRRIVKPYEADGTTGEEEEWKTTCGLQFGRADRHLRLRYKTIAA